MRDRKQMNIFERKVYRIWGPVYDNKKDNWRILSNKEIYAIVKKPTIIETMRLYRLRWFGHVERKEENRIPKTVLYVYKNLGTTRLRGRPRKYGKMKWGRMEEWLVQKGGRKKYITERNGRSSWEQQGIIAFCRGQWNGMSQTSGKLLGSLFTHLFV